MQNHSLITMRIRLIEEMPQRGGNHSPYLAHWIVDSRPPTVNTQVRTWNFPALVKYLTPLNGLYFSPYMSRRLTLRPAQRGEKQSDQWVKKQFNDIKSDNVKRKRHHEKHCVTAATISEPVGYCLTPI